MTFELKLASGKVVTWEGASGEDAALRFVDAHRNETVVAWRHVRHGLFVGVREIVEPGHYLWGRNREGAGGDVSLQGHDS